MPGAVGVGVKPHANTLEVHLHFITNQMTYEPCLGLCSNSRNSIRKLNFLMFFIHSEDYMDLPGTKNEFLMGMCPVKLDLPRMMCS